MTTLDIQTARDRAQEMIDNDSGRIALCDTMRDMFLMEWDGQPAADWVKRVVSPDAYDAAVGITRLIMAAEPAITVASPESTVEELARDDETERALRAILRRSEEARETSAIIDAALSAVLFGEVVFRVSSGRDLATLARENKNTALAEAAERVPYMLECLNPAGVYTQADALGTRRAVIVETTTAGTVRELWGKRAENVTDDDTAEVELYDYWDRTHRAVWVKNGADILSEPHGLPFVPIIRRVVQGTGLWTWTQGETVFPLLYGLHKSGFWDAQNIAYTMIYSLAYAMGSVPFIALEKESPNQPDPEIDWTRPGINMTLYKGQKLHRMPLDTIPAEMLQVLQVVEAKVPELLMPKVVFGQAPGASMSFSAINLLSQGGRLPLVPVQRGLGDALAAALVVVLRWAILEADAVEVYSRGVLTRLDPEALDPARLWVEVDITPDIPMDRVQLGTLVTQLEARGIISKKTAREWLHILDSTAEDEQILIEQFIAQMAAEFAQEAAKRSDLPETLGGAAAMQDGPEMDITGDPGTGPMFDTGAGGLPQVQAGVPPVVAAMMPGGGGEA